MAVTYNAVVTYNLQVSLAKVQTVWIIVKASETAGLSDEDIFLDVCQVYGAFPISSFGEVESKTFAFGSSGWDMFSGNPFLGIGGGRQTRYPDMTSANWGLDNTIQSNMGNIGSCTKYDYLDQLGIPKADHRFVQINVPGVDIKRWSFEDTGVMWPGNLYFTGSSTKAVNMYNLPTQEPFFKEVMESALQIGRFGTSMLPVAKLPIVKNVYSDGAPNADFPVSATPYPGATAALQASSGCPPSDHPEASTIQNQADSFGRNHNGSMELDYPGWSIIDQETVVFEVIKFDTASGNQIFGSENMLQAKGSELTKFQDVFGARELGRSDHPRYSAFCVNDNYWPHSKAWIDIWGIDPAKMTSLKFYAVKTDFITWGQCRPGCVDLATGKFHFVLSVSGATSPEASFFAKNVSVGDSVSVTFMRVSYDECGGASGGAPPPARFTSAPTIASAGSATGAPSSSPVSAIAVPPVHSYPTTGGSILLLHSNTNPPTKPTTPTPQDFFDKGKPAPASSTLNHAFVQDSLTNVVLTDNSINTIFYYLMDVAQNIQYIGEVTFYVDRNKPVGFITPPSGASWDVPYTYEWLGKNKMAPFDGRIEMSDLPETNPIKTWPYTI